MANHPNRNWRRKWVINYRQQQATHESGLVVEYYSGCEPIRAIRIPDTFINDLTWDKARTLSRLMKEANELWSEKNEG